MFQSQLILAVIAQPLAPLDELIGEATSCMSPVSLMSLVSFGGWRESLKKSLAMVRAGGESGVFELKMKTGGGDANGGPSPVSSEPELVYEPVPVHYSPQDLSHTLFAPATLDMLFRGKRFRGKPRVSPWSGAWGVHGLVW